MDKIFIDDLVLETQIGVYAFEQKIKQKLMISLELATDFRQASIKDDIKLTVDYAAVAEAIIDHVEKNHYQLLETLAENLAEVLLTRFQSPRLKLTIKKPQVIKNIRAFGIMIERENPRIS